MPVHFARAQLDWEQFSTNRPPTLLMNPPPRRNIIGVKTKFLDQTMGFLTLQPNPTSRYNPL